MWLAWTGRRKGIPHGTRSCESAAAAEDPVVAGDHGVEHRPGVGCERDDLESLGCVAHGGTLARVPDDLRPLFPVSGSGSRPVRARRPREAARACGTVGGTPRRAPARAQVPDLVDGVPPARPARDQVRQSTVVCLRTVHAPCRDTRPCSAGRVARLVPQAQPRPATPAPAEPTGALVPHGIPHRNAYLAGVPLSAPFCCQAVAASPESVGVCRLGFGGRSVVDAGPGSG